MKNIKLLAIFIVLSLALFSAGCSKKITTEGTPTSGNSYGLSDSDFAAASQEIEGNIIHFAYNSYELTSESRTLLQRKAAVLNKYPQLKIRIAGHTDERGTNEYNMALGERRARAVYDFLTNLGVNGANCETISFGEEYPIVQGSNEAAWAQNRRAEFKIL